MGKTENKNKRKRKTHLGCRPSFRPIWPTLPHSPPFPRSSHLTDTWGPQASHCPFSWKPRTHVSLLWTPFVRSIFSTVTDMAISQRSASLGSSAAFGALSSSSPGWASAHRKPRIPRGGGESVERAMTAEFRAIFLDPSRPRILRIKSNASAFVPAAIRHPQASRRSPAMAKLLVLCTAPYCHYDFLISPHRAAVTLPLRFPLLAANREARSG
jgi:hypothetical protein